MNNLFSVKTENNLASLLKKFQSKICIVLVFKLSCSESINHYLMFGNFAKKNNNCIFVLLNTDDFYPTKIIDFPELIIYKNGELFSVNKLSQKDNITILLKNISMDLTVNNKNQEKKYSKNQKINKILELINILNGLYMEELTKLSMMKDIHRNLP